MRTIVAFALLFICLFTGCQTAPTHKGKQVFRVNLGGNPATLDPAKARDLNSITLLRMLFEGLTRIATDEKPELALASDLKISEDAKTYTFTLRKSRWSNGEGVTAFDFVYAWRRALDPAFPSDYASQMYVLKNAKAIKEGNVNSEALGVRALDDVTLRIELEKPTPYFLELLSYPVFFPVSEKWVKRHPHFAEKQKTYVCNGPFCLKQWKHDDTLIFTRNSRYWDVAKVHLKKVCFVMVNPETELSMFERKELDWGGSPLSSLPVDALKDLKEKGIVKTKSFCGTMFIRVNTKKPGLNNPELRKALSMAINRQEIVEHVTSVGQVVSTFLVPKQFGLHQTSCYSNGTTTLLGKVQITKKPIFTLLYCNGKRNHVLAQALQEQWRKVLGIHIKLEGSERKVFFGRLSKGDFDLVLANWVADFNDPINFLEILKTKETGVNNTGWENATYAKLLDESFSFTDPVKRKAILAKAEKIMLDEMPIIPLYQLAMLYVHQPYVKDVFISSMGNMEVKHAYILEE